MTGSAGPRALWGLGALFILNYLMRQRLRPIAALSELSKAAVLLLAARHGANVPVAAELPSIGRVVSSPPTADQVDAGTALTYS